MISTEIVSASVRTGGLLARAKCLGAGAVLAAAAHAPLSAAMTLDYSAVGSYSNSGFFTGALDDSKAVGAILPDGVFKLSGSETRTDAMFWYYNDYYHQTQPAYDVTGIAFVWGGKLTGGSVSGDTLAAPFDFSVAFTNLLNDPSVSISARLVLGYRTSDFTPTEHQLDPTFYGGGSSTSSYFNYNTAGSHRETGNISVGMPDTTSDLFWYAMLAVQWNGEQVDPAYWNGEYTKLNGDTLEVTVPEHSIDVTYVPANPSGGSVPDSASTGALLGLTLMGLICLHRRR